MNRWSKSKTVHRAASLALGLAVFVIVVSSASAGTTSLSWTGRAADGSDFWSTPSNWQGDKAPATDGSYDALSFGDLGNACDDGAGRTACYESYNDLPSLTVNAVDIDDSSDYYIQGGTISIGSGGITATPGAGSLRSTRARHTYPTSSADTFGSIIGFGSPLTVAPRAERPALDSGGFQGDFDGGSAFDLPIVLSDPQSWSILGGEPQGVSGSEQSDELEVASVTGGYPLSLALDNYSDLNIDGDTEVGTLTISGEGTVDAGTSMNATTGDSVTLSDSAKLDFGAAKPGSGPLDLESGSSLDLFTGVAPEPVLGVNGSYTMAATTGLTEGIDRPGTTAGTDFSKVSASGIVQIGGNLHLYQGYSGNSYGCADLHPGDVDTIVAGVSLTGTFSNAPSGKTITIKNRCDNANVDATAVINYTSDSVTATIKSGGDAGTVPTLSKQLTFKGKLIVGHTITVTHTWTHKPSSYIYRWTRCGNRRCTRFKDTTGHYKLVPSDAGKDFLLRVTAINKSGRASTYAETRNDVRKAPRSKKG